MHYPIIDIQAEYEINRPIRYQITAKKLFPQTTDGRTDVAYDNNIGSFFEKRITTKNQSCNLSNSNNYRTIAIATTTSKLFESVLLLKCSNYLTTCYKQFGFKASHGSDMCIYTLKEFIEYYKNRGTIINITYVTFLDASKAFDRLNY